MDRHTAIRLPSREHNLARLRRVMKPPLKFLEAEEITVSTITSQRSRALALLSRQSTLRRKDFYRARLGSGDAGTLGPRSVDRPGSVGDPGHYPLLERHIETDMASISRGASGGAGSLCPRCRSCDIRLPDYRREVSGGKQYHRSRSRKPQQTPWRTPT
jgi:hypothetical protein